MFPQKRLAFITFNLTEFSIRSSRHKSSLLTSGQRKAFNAPYSANKCKSVTSFCHNVANKQNITQQTVVRQAH